MAAKIMIKTHLLLGIVFFGCLSAIAGGWTWSGKTGNIQIPSGTEATVADSDVEIVAALTGIEIQSGAKLNFSNTGKRCVLAAVLTGDGSCIAGKNALVTFAGASPDYTGAMVFTEAYVQVSALRWGLGCGTDSSGAVRYVSSEGGGLKFIAECTCDPGIYWYDHRYSDTLRFVDDMKRKVVFNGPVKMNKYGNVDWFRTGNFTFNAGFGVNGNNGNFGVYVGGSSQCVTTEINNVAMSGGSAYFPVRVEENAELHLNAAITGSDIALCGLGKAVCGAQNVLAQNMALGRSDSSFTDGKSGTIDLNGFNQSVKSFGSSTYWEWNVVKGDSGFVTVTSSTDASLTITGNSSPLPHACRFADKASLVHSGGGIYTMVNQFSDTEGTLSVENGTVKFDWGAGWGGKVKVFGTGRVVFADRCERNYTDPCTLELYNGAKLEIAEDVMLVCDRVTVDGEELPAGIYSSENFGDWIEGEGTIAIKPVLHEHAVARRWDGGGQSKLWSDAANWSGDMALGDGEKVLVPSGVVVQIADADVEFVETVSSIEIEEGGMLEFVNAEKALVLNGDILGAGDVRSKNSKGITLAGDNFNYTGSMEFTNTPVYVTSRWGLGNPSRPIVHWGADAYALRFRGEGLTNDVPVKFQGVRDSDATRFTDSYDDRWVQNGYLDYLSQSDSPRIGLGNYIFTGGLRNSAGSLQFQVSENMTCAVRKTPLALNMNWPWSHFQIGAGATVRLESAGNQYTQEFSINGFGRLLCCAQDVLCRSKPLCMARSSETPVLDLGGFDQQCQFICNSLAPAKQAYIAERGSQGYGVVTSESAATLTLTSESPFPSAIKFSGAVNLNCTSTGVNTFVNQFSDTIGTLSVANGTVKFDWGAGWGGNIAVYDGGKVEFAETCPGTCTVRATGIVTLSGSAKIAVTGGARYCCASIQLGDEVVTSGVLSSATHPQWIEGDGAVYVGRRGMTLILR